MGKKLAELRKTKFDSPAMSPMFVKKAIDTRCIMPPRPHATKGRKYSIIEQV